MSDLLGPSEVRQAQGHGALVTELARDIAVATMIVATAALVWLWPPVLIICVAVIVELTKEEVL